MLHLNVPDILFVILTSISLFAYAVRPPYPQQGDKSLNILYFQRYIPFPTNLLSYPVCTSPLAPQVSCIATGISSPFWPAREVRFLQISRLLWPLHHYSLLTVSIQLGQPAMIDGIAKLGQFLFQLLICFFCHFITTCPFTVDKSTPESGATASSSSAQVFVCIHGYIRAPHRPDIPGKTHIQIIKSRLEVVMPSEFEKQHVHQRKISCSASGILSGGYHVFSLADLQTWLISNPVRTCHRTLSAESTREFIAFVHLDDLPLMNRRYYYRFHGPIDGWLLIFT